MIGFSEFIVETQFDNINKRSELLMERIDVVRALNKLDSIKKDFEDIKLVRQLVLLFNDFAKMEPKNSGDQVVYSRLRGDISHLLATISRAADKLTVQTKIPEIGNVIALLKDIAFTTQKTFMLKSYRTKNGR